MLHAFAVTLSLFAAVPAEEKDLVPHLDDDTTIVRFSAVPEAYVGKGIYICGFLRVAPSSVSGGFYEGAGDTHYVLTINQVGKRVTLRPMDGRLWLFLPKNVGDPIVTPVIEAQQTNHFGKIVRAKVILQPAVYEFNRKKNWPQDELELLDVQFLTPTGWSPWVLDAPRLARIKRANEAREAQQKEKEARLQAMTPQFREWTDDTGKHKTKAKFVSLAMGNVTLELEGGKKIIIAEEGLSQADRDYIKRRGKSTP